MDQLNLHMPSKTSPPPLFLPANSTLPILQKASTVFKLWHSYLPSVSKSTRYSLGEKISNLFIELVELILQATYASREQKGVIIQKASIKLDALKYFLQIAWEIKAIDNKQFAGLFQPLAEVGKMLGGWQKQIK